MADFRGRDLTGARFEGVDLSRAEFRDVKFTDARFHEVAMERVVMRGVEFADVDVDGYLGRLVVNGVDVVPLVEAELDRRYPERPRMRPADPAGFREAWDIVERLWAGTVERARGLEAALLHESVDGEWSFIETLRHLVFATDIWISRCVFGDPRPWHALGLPADGLPPAPDVPCDRKARPALDEILAVRHDRMATVRTLVDGLTEEQLYSTTEPVDGPGWPPARSYTVHKCLSVVLNEEWEHRLFAERDLSALQARGQAAASLSA